MELQDIVRNFKHKHVPHIISDVVLFHHEIIRHAVNGYQVLFSQEFNTCGGYLASLVIRLCQYSHTKGWDLQIVQSSSFERYFPEGVRKEVLWYEFIRQIVNNLDYAKFEVSMRFTISMVYFFAQRIGVPDLDSEIEKLLISKYE